jgi:EmrB/QacA subfamily drug resistance transporter
MTTAWIARRGSRESASPHNTAIALAALCTLLFLTFLDNTVVSVALGSIQSDLSASVADLQWVVGAYALTFASIMLACGMIGDELGRKAVMLTGAGVFCAGSIICAVAPDPQVLIAGRAVMGLGAAASEPGTLSVLRQMYPDDRARARAVGIWAGVSGLALALGPVVGGLLVGLWSWRGIFWFNLAFGLAALIVAALVVPESSDPRAGRVDALGTLLGAASLGTLVAAIIDAETNGFANPAVILMLCVSAVTAVGFVWWEGRATHPLLDLKFFRNRQFTIPNVVAFASYFATFAVFFFMALYLVLVDMDSGYRIALIFLPMTVLMIVASVITGRWIPRLGARWTITIGCLFYGAGLILTNLYIKPHDDSTGLIISLALVGIGIGVTVVPVTTSVLSSVPADRSGMAASVANTSREIGAVTGVAILGALVSSRLAAELGGQLSALGVPALYKPIIINGIMTGQTPTAAQISAFGPDILKVYDAAYGAFGTGIHWALWLSAGLVLAASVLTAAAMKDNAPEAINDSPASSAPESPSLPGEASLRGAAGPEQDEGPRADDHLIARLAGVRRNCVRRTGARRLAAAGLVAVKLGDPFLRHVPHLRQHERERLPPAVDEDQEVVVAQQGAI